MTDGDLAVLLVASMLGDANVVCTDPLCEGCETFRRIWWDTYNRLDMDATVAVAVASMVEGVPFPPSPTPEYLV